MSTTKNAPITYTAESDEPKNGLSALVTKAYIFLVLVVLPLYFDGNRYSAITKAKHNCFIWLTVPFIALIVLSAIVDRNTSIPSPKKLWGSMSFTQKLIVGYMLLCVVSFAINFHSYGAEMLNGMGRNNGLITQLLYSAIFLIVSVYGRFDRKYIYAFGGSMTVFNIVAWLQFWGLNPFGFYNEGKFYGNTPNFVSTIGNVDMVASMLCMAVPLFIFAVAVLDGKLKYLLILPAAMSMITLFQVDVSAGYLSVAGAFFLLFPLLFSRLYQLRDFLLTSSVLLLALSFFKALRLDVSYYHLTMKKSFSFGKISVFCIVLSAVCLVLAFAVLLLQRYLESRQTELSAKKLALGFCGVQALSLVGVLVYLFNYGGAQNGVIYEASQIIKGNFDDRFGTYRMWIWKNSIKLFPEKPLFGGGPDSFVKRFKLKTTNYAGKTIYYDEPHNTYLQILLNTGIFSAMSFIGALLTDTVKGIGTYFVRPHYLGAPDAPAQKARKSAIDSLTAASKAPEALILLAPVVAYSINIFFIFTLSMVTPVFFVMWGLLDSRITQAKRIKEYDR